MPEPEQRLWLELRAGRFGGVKFRRQKVVQDETRKAIVDFAANDPKLVIELDGETHVGRETRDAARTRFLESRGYRVVRFANSDVMANMDGVLMRIGEVVAEMRGIPLPPTPSPEGEGENKALSPSGERVGRGGVTTTLPNSIHKNLQKPEQPLSRQFSLVSRPMP